MGEQRATFSAMQEGTAEDWGIISDHYRPFAKQLPDRIIAHLMLLDKRPHAHTAMAVTRNTSSARYYTTSATPSAATTTPISLRPS